MSTAKRASFGANSPAAPQKKAAEREPAGLVRGLDQMGRVVIPKEMLQVMGLEPRDRVEILSMRDEDGVDCVIIRAYRPGCALCGEETEDYREHPTGRRVCRECLELLIAR